jgi:hypothetical protein
MLNRKNVYAEQRSAADLNLNLQYAIFTCHGLDQDQNSETVIKYIPTLVYQF